MPIWRRRTRHGRVLSLDADLDGLSLYDLVAANVDHLAHTTGGMFDDERLNAVLRGLDLAERQVVFAYAEGDGTTWTEAAASFGAVNPQASGERVRRKARRLAAERRRRAAQRRVECPRAPGRSAAEDKWDCPSLLAAVVCRPEVLELAPDLLAHPLCLQGWDAGPARGLGPGYVGVAGVGDGHGPLVGFQLAQHPLDTVLESFQQRINDKVRSAGGKREGVVLA